MTRPRRFSRASSSNPSPEAGRELQVFIAGKFLPAREICLETPRRHARILCRVDRAAALPHNGIQFVQQAQRLLPVIGKVQRQRQARSREREQARRRPIPELLQHRQERSLPGTANALKKLAHSLAPIGERHHALILQEAASPVEPVPVLNRVQRIKKRVIMHKPAHGRAQLRAIIQRVKRLYHSVLSASEGRSKGTLRGNWPRCLPTRTVSGAWLPRIKIPRQTSLPPIRQSTQETVYS